MEMKKCVFKEWEGRNKKVCMVHGPRCSHLQPKKKSKGLTK